MAVVVSIVAALVLVAIAGEYFFGAVVGGFIFLAFLFWLVITEYLYSTDF